MYALSPYAPPYAPSYAPWGLQVINVTCGSVIMGDSTFYGDSVGHSAGDINYRITARSPRSVRVAACPINASSYATSGLWLGSILRLPITCSCVDALNTPSSKLPLSPTVSRFLQSV